MLLVTGTIAFDHIMDFNRRFADYIMPDKIHKINISFTTKSIKKEFGGTGGNQSYNLALLGEKPVLCTTVGSDFEEYRNFLQDTGVVVDYVEERNKPCAVGFVMTDRDDNQIWAYGSGAAGEINKFSLGKFINKLKAQSSKLKTAKFFVMIAPMQEDAMISWARECRKLGIRYMFDPAFYIPAMKSKELESAVAGAEIVFGNDYEIELINSKLSSKGRSASGRKAQMSKLQLKSQKLKVVIETLGAKGSVVYDLENHKEIKIRAVKPRKIVDPTGAGDAYRAGFIAGYLRGLNLKTCGRMGSVAASFAIEKYGTINHSFTIEEFRERYKESYGGDYIGK